MSRFRHKKARRGVARPQPSTIFQTLAWRGFARFSRETSPDNQQKSEKKAPEEGPRATKKVVAQKPFVYSFPMDANQRVLFTGRGTGLIRRKKKGKKR
jgi:hypothetical protein